MTLSELLEKLPPTGPAGLAIPRRLLGAFRRRSITFCDGTSDVQTVVFWFQSRSFTVDLRLPDAAATPVHLRQGWAGDTHWDEARQEMSWSVERGYQPHNQWPEPARLSFIGNCVLEFAPSGAYVEDWRRQSVHGPMLGLRLLDMRDETSGQTYPMVGGLVVAGEHTAYARSRLPAIDDVLLQAGSVQEALAEGLITEREVESGEVSVAMDGAAITHSTRPGRLGHQIVAGEFRLEPDGSIRMLEMIDRVPCRLRFDLDFFQPDFAFDHQTERTREAEAWMAREAEHLARHATGLR